MGQEEIKKMANDVRIKLTDAQRQKIKTATGKEMNELRVGSLSSTGPVAPDAAPHVQATRANATRAHATRAHATRANATRANATRAGQ